MKLERLLSTIIYLLNHHRVSAHTLADKFEVSLRTIQRDIDTLTLAGIPIVAYTGVNGGYEIMDEYRMQVQLANQSDYDYILSALKGLHSALANKQINQTLEKVESLSNNDKQHLILDFSTLKEKEEITGNLTHLEEWIVNKALVSFDYTNAKGICSTKIVEPLAVIYKWYSWYLVGFDTLKNEYRYFKVIRMRNMIKKNGFCKHLDVDPLEIINNQMTKDTREYYDIKILCKKEYIVKAIEYLNGKIVSKNQNGNYILQLHVPKDEELWKGSLLAFGGNIKILDPIEVKEELLERCNRFINCNYDI